MNGRDGAVAAARQGWAVFPVLPRSKRPLVPDWEGRACSDPDRVARYWPSPDHNVGGACGPSGRVVIDLDTHGTIPADWRLPGIASGADVLAQICQWAGRDWPYTYTVATPLNGWHLVFTEAGHHIRNSAGRIGPMIDVRASGGYVLLPGSVLDGRAYPRDPAAAAQVRGGRAYTVLNDTAPARLPGWLATLAMPPQELPPAGRAGHGGGSPTGRLRGLADMVRAGQPGDRNGRLYWAACRAREMVSAGEVGRQDAAEDLVSAALEAGLRGGEAEARRTVASAMRGGDER